MQVQCPQVAKTTKITTIVALAVDVGILATANPLRSSIIMSSGDFGKDIAAQTQDLAGNEGVYPLQSSFNGVLYTPILIVDESWGGFAALEWDYFNGDPGNVTVDVLESIYQCRAVILATSQFPAVAGGTYGTVPPGIWLSSDMDTGPTIFNLQDTLDGEVTWQKWYAWPVGSVAVNVTVTEAWDEDQPAETPKKFNVTLPKLSPDGIAALNALLDSMGQYNDQNAVAGTLEGLDSVQNQTNTVEFDGGLVDNSSPGS